MTEREKEDDFVPYEKMSASTTVWLKRLGVIRKWVATEKIHGANFSFTVFKGENAEETVVKVAKRSSFLKDSENFFGVHKHPKLIEEESEKAQGVFQTLCRDDRDTITTITIYGELFGGSYSHPEVPTCAGVQAVQREVVYCPDLKFIAYDISVTIMGMSRRYLDYDKCMELFKSVGFFYAEPLLIGTLQDMVNFPLGFESTIPGKLGLPPLPNNVAEGIVVKPLHDVVLDSKQGMKRVIFKRKVEGFMEKKTRCEHFQKKSVKETPVCDEVLKYEVLALVTEQRLVNTISKLGLPSPDGTGPSWKEIHEALCADVIEEFKSDKELWGEFTSMSKHLKGMLIAEMRDDCDRIIEEYITKNS